MQEYNPEEPTDADAKIEPIVDHGAIVQGWLTNPNKKLILRKDESADKMLSVTKFTNNNTMLGSILSDIASRMLTSDDNDERVANFASRVADGLENEGELFNEPNQDWMKNKKIAIQLARRYIEDYKKMQKDPAYADEIRQEPGAFKPKKDRSGKAKETAEFEQWVDDTIDPKEEVKEEPKKEVKEEVKITFEDIKPFIEKHLASGGNKSTAIETAMKTFKEQEPQELPRQLKDPNREVMVSKHGKTIVIDKEKKQEYLAKGWTLSESRTKIVEAIKNKADTGFNIAGIEGDDDRVTGDAGLEIARLKYLSKYH
jgi:hypothetical protein